MKILIMSDLHNEFERSRGPRNPTGAWFELNRLRRRTEGHPPVGPLLTHLKSDPPDMVILAGDIDVGANHAIRYADQVSLYLGVPVISVCGNHEFYCHDIDQVIADMRIAARATQGRVTFLENDATLFDIKGKQVRVLGCTLWTDFLLSTPGGEGFMHTEDKARAAAMKAAWRGINDFLSIRSGTIGFGPEAALDRHEKSRAWLKNEIECIRLENGDDATILVVTHHAPVLQGINPRYRGDRLNPAYASDMRTEITGWRPDLWCWGHTHFCVDEMFGETRLVSQQRGYVGHEEPWASEFLPSVTVMSGAKC